MMKEIPVSGSLRVSIGNLGPVAEATGYEKPYNRCVALERLLKSDYTAFAHNYRLVLEEFVICEETHRRIVESGMRYIDLLRGTKLPERFVIPK